MKKTLIISLLIAFSAAFLSSCDRKSKSNDVVVQQDSVPQNSSTSKSNKKNNTVIWGALIISLLANAGFTMFCYSRMKECLEERYGELNKKYKGLNNSIYWDKHQSSKQSIVKYELSDADINMIVDRVLECKRLDRDEKESSIVTVKQTTEKPIVTDAPQKPTIIKILYATATKENDNTFIRVTEQSDDDTVYILSLTDDNNATFVVSDNVLEDYLRNACNLIGAGNNIESCEPGHAEKTSDGFWKVTKKANVKFV